MKDKGMDERRGEEGEKMRGWKEEKRKVDKG